MGRLDLLVFLIYGAVSSSGLWSITRYSTFFSNAKGEWWSSGSNSVVRLENPTAPVQVAELAELLGVTPQHIYKKAVCGKLPSIRISGAVRFDPQEVGDWLKKRRPGTARAGQSQIPSVAA